MTESTMPFGPYKLSLTYTHTVVGKVDPVGRRGETSYSWRKKLEALDYMKAHSEADA